MSIKLTRKVPWKNRGKSVPDWWPRCETCKQPIGACLCRTEPEEAKGR